MSGCIHKQAKIVSSATILIKTPTMKFYDRGFISQYNDYIHLQVFSAGTAILDLNIYDDKVCKDSFRCQSSSSFNKEFLHKSYEKDFLKKLLSKSKKKIVFRDKENKILIKVLKD